MRSCYSHKGISPGKHPGNCASYDKIGKEDIQSINNGTYTQCSLCGIIHKDPHKQKLYPLREDQYSREG
ncbi:conserved Plasmodium protein, unknown function [Plasmodium reichenowi]|uniref:Uncharacterized protein n=1 Tax=Plasmodium reichenowi TaxID=5854 RepID=A0A060RUN1_PLARE|nr:hypothetical protein PRSY57_1125700 [Plasmodium reichenowi]KYN96607.1 hypothetical protein PRSY57_1125700 [Plasmodium reichenowi]CDO65076.1 conserved Plasmodium protein, unknown function [Plasmodium reichenowi]SOV78125.1 conserved Plasmodium protein, unknown function [Plasmodium sp. gorilla clade G3]SOV80203.1 conserved Plasmodium protein, unknown function [Plasmodium reichenowi]